MNLDNGTLPDPLAIVALPDKKIAEKHWKSWYKPPISRIIPPILQTYTSFLCQISSAFPVRFPAFPHKRNDTLSCPQQKRGQKPERDTILSHSFAVHIHKGDQYIAPKFAFRT